MREIVKPNGEVYAKVWIDKETFQIQLVQSKERTTIIMDAKIVPHLRQILVEAEFLKYI